MWPWLQGGGRNRRDSRPERAVVGMARSPPLTADGDPASEEQRGVCEHTQKLSPF